MNETIDEVELDEVSEAEIEESEEIEVLEEPENDFDFNTLPEFFANINSRLDAIEAKLESVAAPIRTLSQKGTSEANTSEAASPTLLYL